MSIITAYFYDSDGRIVYIRSGSEQSVDHERSLSEYYSTTIESNLDAFIGELEDYYVNSQGKLDKRRKMSLLTYNNNVPVGDDIEILNLPINTKVTMPSGITEIVDDGSVVLNASQVGKYKFIVDNPAYLVEEFTIVTDPPPEPEPETTEVTDTQILNWDTAYGWGNHSTQGYLTAVDWAMITSKPVTATRWPTWTEVTSKPTTFTPSAHTHALADIKDAGSAALVDTGTAAGNVPTVADMLAGNWTFENVLDVSGTGNKIAYLHSTDNGAIQLRFRTDSTNRRFLAMDQANNTQSQLNFGNGEVHIYGATTSGLVKLAVGLDSPSEALDVNGNANIQGQIYQEYTPYALIAVTTTGQIRTIDVANGPVQTISADEDFTLSATGPSGKLANVAIYVYNASTTQNITVNVTGKGIEGNNLLVAIDNSRVIQYKWDGIRAVETSQIARNGDLRPT